MKLFNVPFNSFNRTLIFADLAENNGFKNRIFPRHPDSYRDGED